MYLDNNLLNDEHEVVIRLNIFFLFFFFFYINRAMHSIILSSPLAWLWVTAKHSFSHCSPSWPVNVALWVWHNKCWLDTRRLRPTHLPTHSCSSGWIWRSSWIYLPSQRLCLIMVIQYAHPTLQQRKEINAHLVTAMVGDNAVEYQRTWLGYCILRCISIALSSLDHQCHSVSSHTKSGVPLFFMGCSVR